jgi:hypothetical protein
MKILGIALLTVIVVSTAHGDAEGQLFSRVDLGGKAGLNIASEVDPDADGIVIKNVNRPAFSVGGDRLLLLTQNPGGAGGAAVFDKGNEVRFQRHV